jgi:hypothetical protein
MTMQPDYTTEELEELAREREAAEQKLVDAATDDEEAAQHLRRVEKTRYLRKKLKEREKSEKEPKK